MSAFAELGLAEPLLRAVSEAGYETPTPIQARAIPLVMSGHDVMGGAQTGTGKTAAFALPILQRLLPHANTSVSPARHPVRALILAPTRELAIQVEESFREYGKHTGLRTGIVYGGMDMHAQTAMLRAGVEVLVATPGRLLDHVQQKTLVLNQVEVFVLDEADRMLDMGFIPDVKRIIGLMPAKRQNLLFSATFSNEIKKLADHLLNQPELIEVARRNAAAENVEQSVYLVGQEDKRFLLEHIIRSRDLWQVLVFVRTKHGAGRLARLLERDGLKTASIHGDKTQQARLEALDAFKRRELQALVATDVAARGLDIEEMPLVVNYEVPYVPEDYIHRIGRTGRAGALGEAISLVAPDEVRLMEDVERLLKRKLPRLEADFPRAGRERDRDRGRDRERERGPRRAGGRPATASGEPASLPPAWPSTPAPAYAEPTPEQAQPVAPHAEPAPRPAAPAQPGPVPSAARPALETGRSAGASPALRPPGREPVAALLRRRPEKSPA